MAGDGLSHELTLVQVVAFAALVELIEESLEEEADMDEILTEIAEAGADNVTV